MSAKLRVLAITAADFDRVREHLFPGDGKEAVAIALCGKAEGTRRSQLLVHEVIPVPYDACSEREPDAVTWRVETVLPALGKAMRSGLTVVKFHSHPGGYRDFSDADDMSDRELFSAVSNVLDSDDLCASVIMLPDGGLIGRSIRRGVIGEPIDLFRIVGDEFVFIRPPSTDVPDDLPEHALRIVQSFGEGTYRTLQQLRIGVVGASGTGSIVLEQLARNSVGAIVIADPSKIKRKNLNRILNARGQDADGHRLKVDRAVEAILEMGLGTDVTGLPYDIFHNDVMLSLSECDVLFGCTDSVDGRHILNKISTHFLIPLIDMGVRIDADGYGNVEQVTAAIHTILPGGSSLMSRGVYSQDDLNAAFMQRHEQDRYESMLAAGYIKGAAVDRPAVITLNSVAASYAVNELLARLKPYRAEPNSTFSAWHISLSDPLATRADADGAVCQAFAKRKGFGAAEPLLGMV